MKHYHAFLLCLSVHSGPLVGKKCTECLKRYFVCVCGKMYVLYCFYNKLKQLYFIVFTFLAEKEATPV